MGHAQSRCSRYRRNRIDQLLCPTLMYALTSRPYDWEISDPRRHARGNDRNNNAIWNATGTNHIARAAQNRGLPYTYARVCTHIVTVGQVVN